MPIRTEGNKNNENSSTSSGRSRHRERERKRFNKLHILFIQLSHFAHVNAAIHPLTVHLLLSLLLLLLLMAVTQSPTLPLLVMSTYT